VRPSLIVLATIELLPLSPTPVSGQDFVVDGKFESGVSGWDTPVGVSLVRERSGHSGLYGGRVSNATSRRLACGLRGPAGRVDLTAEGSYVGGVWVRGGAVGERFTIRLREYSGASTIGVSSSWVRLIPSWQFVATSYRVKRPRASSLDLSMGVDEASPGVCFHVDDVSVQLLATARAIGGIATRREALARSGVVVESGLHTEAYQVESPSVDATYDLRTFRSSAYPEPAEYPLTIGSEGPAPHTVVVGGTILGKLDRGITWQEAKDIGGGALYLAGSDWLASYDLKADNVEDGFKPRVASGTQQGNSTLFMLEGAYMTYIRDDAIEDDDLMSGYIRDSLIDGTFMFLSAQSSDGFTNPHMVVRIDRTIVRLQAMPSDESQDGMGHGKIFKWQERDEEPGTVVVRHSIFFFAEVPEGSRSNMAFPKGKYRDVTVVLGRRFDGDGDGDTRDYDYPVRLPKGVRQTRHVWEFTRARDLWLAAHGYAVTATKRTMRRITTESPYRGVRRCA
jgi:hypothetical protein